MDMMCMEIYDIEVIFDDEYLSGSRWKNEMKVCDMKTCENDELKQRSEFIMDEF